MRRLRQPRPGRQRRSRALELKYNDDYHLYNQKMSRADFWALAAIVGIQVGAAEGKEMAEEDNSLIGYDLSLLNIDLSPGRVDCPTSPNSNDKPDFPHTMMKPADMFAYFQTHFQFNAAETVALMGAHTLGQARLENSGHFGEWTAAGNMFAFDKRFYHELVEPTYAWTQENMGTAEKPKWQWKCTTTEVGEAGLPCGFMLHTDVALVKDVTLDTTGKATCEFNQCSAAATAPQVLAYDEDSGNNQWYKDFKAVFTKLINRK